MSNRFRELLKKVGSGTHTSTNLTRSEAATATRMILLQEATPAQIGAFMIAQRIKRPTGEELAGMLDAYDELGSKVPEISHQRPVVVLGVPYDGRSRTVPVVPLTALVLATAGCPVLTHGGDIMPTKYGIPLVAVWQALGLDWTNVSLDQLQQILQQTSLGFYYAPRHFPLAMALVPYRDQIGKRPPFATLELIWSPYAGPAHLIAGFVHPPTEQMIQIALTLTGSRQFTTVKGLEGSCDLPRDRTAIMGIYQADTSPDLQRLLLNARDYNLAGPEVSLPPMDGLPGLMDSVLQGHPSALMQATLWNSGFYLWHCGLCDNLTAGIELAQHLLQTGQVLEQLRTIQAVLKSSQLVSQA